jgi:hypothetical protein
MKQVLRKAILFTFIILNVFTLSAKPGDGDTTPFDNGYAAGKLTVYVAIIVVAIVVIRKLRKQ